MSPNIPAPGPVEINSTNQWNKALRDAKPQNRVVVVDFHATWCGPCKAIAPTFDALSVKHYQHADFLRVDVDAQRAIAQKYKISSMPTFIFIRNGEVLDTLKGADPRGLSLLIEKHATAPELAPAAELQKSKGNKQFAEKHWAKAVEHYTAALEHEPKSSVLYANRCLAYVRMAQDPQTPLEQRLDARKLAAKDAFTIPPFDERWPKGYIRMAECLLLAHDEEALANMEMDEEARVAKRREAVLAAEEALESAVVYAAGTPQMKAEAEKRLADLRSQMQKTESP